jgi:hypothetical protein
MVDLNYCLDIRSSTCLLNLECVCAHKIEEKQSHYNGTFLHIIVQSSLLILENGWHARRLKSFGANQYVKVCIPETHCSR